ncbi:MAG: hypothetical protein JSR87_09595 [Proteobacteria bacterium]|nr:hypothetical protein [Pseudomonadota bacterium]MBS0574199.1 hypothetical protein [Pseudomonadota bacterium]
MRNLMVGISLVLALAGEPAAADTLYKCNYATSRTTKEPGKHDLFIQYDGRSDRAMAMDSFAYDPVRHPDLVPVRVRSLGGREFQLQWEVDDVRKGSYSSDLRYIARLDVQALSVDVTISPVSYPVPWHFTGACIAEKLK